MRSSPCDFVVFEIGRANLGDAGERSSAPELCREWNSRFQQRDIPLRIRPGFRHTGNYLLRSGAEGPIGVAEASRCVSDILIARAAVFAAPEFLAWLQGIEVWARAAPAIPPGRRPTPGAVMNVDPHAGIPPVLSASGRLAGGAFAAPRVRSVWKFDILRSDGKLDRNQREGGWGAVATAMADEHGGRWTGRALSTLRGVARKLEATRALIGEER